METPLLSECKVGKEFMNKLFEIFPDAQVESSSTSKKDDVFEARIKGVQLSHEDLERVLQNKPLRFRIENGNLIARLDVSNSISDDKRLVKTLLFLLWLFALIITVWHVSTHINSFRHIILAS